MKKNFNCIVLYCIVFATIILGSCENRELREKPVKNSFFNNDIAATSLKSGDSEADFRLQVIEYLQKVDDSTHFTKEFVELYGLPQWDAIGYIGDENQRAWVVPVVEDEGIGALWLFTLDNTLLRFSLLFRGDCRLNEKEQKSISTLFLYFESIIFKKNDEIVNIIQPSLKKSFIVNTEFCVHYYVEYGGERRYGMDCTTSSEIIVIEDKIHEYDGSKMERGHYIGGGSANPRPIIKDSLMKYPCATEVLEQINGFDSKISNLLKKTFGVNSNILLTIKPKAFPNSGKEITDGTFKVSKTIRYNKYDKTIEGEAVIYIDSMLLENATKEYIAATYAHEAVHGLLAYFKSIDSKQAVELFPTYFEYKENSHIITPRLSSLFEHQEMAKNYVDEIVDVIKLVNPNMDSHDATMLAWNGLQGTVAYNKAKDEYNQIHKDKNAWDNNIVKINRREKKSLSDAKGTPCY